MARAAQVDMRSTITRAGDGIAVNFAPLVAPHRKAGRISIRVERLPQQARFSRGNRNSNGTWSLASDELDDLSYYIAEGTGDHTLSIRIINLTGGNTLAVVDYPVSAAAQLEEIAEEVAEELADGTDELVDGLRQQLAQMKAKLSAREAELAEARKANRAAAPVRDTDAELGELRTELQTEFDERLAAVGAQSAADLKKQRESWSSDINARLATLTAKAQQQLNEAGETAEREKQQALELAKTEWQREEADRFAAAETSWQEATRKALTEARAEAATASHQLRNADIEDLRAKLERDAQEAVAVAQAAWKTEETARLATAEARWRAEADKALAEARSQTSASRDSSHTEALNDLRASLECEAQAALAKAQDDWKAQEAARLVTAKAEWQRATDRAVADARATAAAGEQNTDSAINALRVEVTNLQAMIAERDTALTDASKAIERAQHDAQASRAAAETRWKAEEASRLAAEQAKWRAETDATLAKARTDMTTAQSAGKDAIHDDLRQQLAGLSTKLAERDAALAKARAEGDELRRDLKALQAKPAAPGTQGPDPAFDDLREKIASLEESLADRGAELSEAREIIEQQRQAAKAKPQRTTRKSEDSSEERWAAITNELAEAKSRYEAAELALAQVRMRAKDEGRIHQDLTSTRAALAAREKELTDLRAIVRPLDGQEPNGEPAHTVAAATPVKPQPYSRGFIGAVIAAACLLASVIIFYPSIDALFRAPPPPLKTEPAPKIEERLEPVAVEVKATLLRDVRLRAEPATGSKVVANATRGFEVVVIEAQGKWTLVRLGDEKAPQGWVSSSALTPKQ